MKEMTSSNPSLCIVISKSRMASTRMHSDSGSRTDSFTVFLGERYKEFESEKIIDYPCPRIADFGLAKLASFPDRDNNPLTYQRGTRTWYPPELRRRHFRQSSAFGEFSLFPAPRSCDFTNNVLHEDPFAARYPPGVPRSSEYGNPLKGRHRIGPEANL